MLYLGLMPRRSTINGLYLCHIAIHKQFRSRDVSAVLGSEKHHSKELSLGKTLVENLTNKEFDISQYSLLVL
jgi:hypothetical protein